MPLRLTRVVWRGGDARCCFRAAAAAAAVGASENLVEESPLALPHTLGEAPRADIKPALLMVKTLAPFFVVYLRAP